MLEASVSGISVILIALACTVFGLVLGACIGGAIVVAGVKKGYVFIDGVKRQVFILREHS